MVLHSKTPQSVEKQMVAASIGLLWRWCEYCMHAILLLIVIISEGWETVGQSILASYLILKIPKKETSRRTVFRFLIHCFGGFQSNIPLVWFYLREFFLFFKASTAAIIMRLWDNENEAATVWLCRVREMASMDDQGLVVALPRKGGCS